MIKKLNVLFISHAGGLGGAEMCLFDLVSHLSKEEFNVYINVPIKGGLSANLEKAGIPYFVNTTGVWIPSKPNWGVMHVVRFIKTLLARTWSLETKIKNYKINSKISTLFVPDFINLSLIIFLLSTVFL